MSMRVIRWIMPSQGVDKCPYIEVWTSPKRRIEISLFIIQTLPPRCGKISIYRVYTVEFTVKVCYDVS